MNKRKNLALLLLFSFILMPFHVQAESNRPEIIICQGAQDVPEEIIQELIAQNPDAGTIQLIDYEYLPEIVTPLVYLPDATQNATPITGYYTTYGPITTTKTVTSYNSLAKDELMFSVAKGETITLSSAYTASLKGSMSGNALDAADIGADITITGAYEEGTNYSGPSEDSIYNTREFRMKFYQNIGDYTQSRKVFNYFIFTLLSIETKTESGTFKEPTKFLTYSIDKIIE